MEGFYTDLRHVFVLEDIGKNEVGDVIKEQSERVIIGKCPRCGENVYEGKKNFYCGNRGCQFVM